MSMDSSSSGMLPAQYKLARKAGGGSSADVYFCLPKDVINTVKAQGPIATHSPNLGDHFATLRSSLVAVKIIRGKCPDPEADEYQYPEEDSNAKEYTLLQKIQTSTLPGAE